MWSHTHHPYRSPNACATPLPAPNPQVAEETEEMRFNTPAPLSVFASL